jgi:AraC family transcriptional regulator
MRYSQDSAIDTLLRGSYSKSPQNGNIWSQIRVERRVVGAVERAEEQLDHHYLLFWSGEPTIAEREYRPGRFQRVIKRAGTISLGSAGRLPAVRALTPYDVIACVIDATAAQRHLDELEYSGTYRLHQHLGIVDQPLAYLMKLLMLEVDSEGASGRLYCDSIEQAVISRFLVIARAEGAKSANISPLPHKPLQRILDKMTNEYSRSLTLADLAHESGYSRAHFLRMFQMATGKTPFQHLRDIRLDEARRALLDTDEGLSSIAFRVGFSSHSHLTRLFTKRFGTSPGAFRRKP